MFSTRWPIHSTGILKTDAAGESVVTLAELDFGVGSSEQPEQDPLGHEFVLEMLDAERRLIRCDFVRMELRLDKIESRCTSNTNTPKSVSVRWRPRINPNKNVIKFNCKGIRAKGRLRLSATIKLTAKNSQVCVMPFKIRIMKLLVTSDVW
ncbi:hypothetical protein CROQUDRAFT_46763 [Cronartium quercuum f. sp. fusiforme G11]|uniref:Uncharacterized protein n=1 Tax=Cronartium quercuum f. sp. fusiforme G11 TaxID=708437 RepID=A0A9P6TAP9_9BASI|nr:hypothetical protein CROQUDRAFT_46763 [Cronartium quercuum f. sp. fusiforme G11]